MSAPGSDLAIAEARLLIAACIYVDVTSADATHSRVVIGVMWEALFSAVADYRAALRGAPLPADHPLVKQGMAVVRRLLGQQETTE